MAHFAQAAAACPASFGRQHTHDPVVLENGLNGPFAEAVNLAAPLGHQRIRIERQPLLFGVAGNYKGDTQGALAAK